jgi:DNA-binding response OmpR family regulator
MVRPILVAEDDPEIAGLLKLALEDEGYVAHFSHDSRHAVEAVRSGQYSLLIADQLAGSPTGLSEVTRHWVVQVAGSQPTVLLTGRDWAARADAEERKRLADELGVSAILPKPFDVDVLLDVVRRLLESATPGD